MKKISKNNLLIFKKIIKVYLIWLAALLAITLLKYWGHDFNFEFWATWDGGHFRGIAENGYLPQQTVFFPLYPLLIKILMFFGVPSLWGGLIISHFSLIGTLFFLYKLVLLDFDKKTAFRTLIALLIFPTSFFLGVVYGESLFLFGATGAFYFARTNRFGLASLFAAITVGTRIVGISVVIGILVEYLAKNKRVLDRRVFYIFSSLLPLWLYIIYQYYTFNNSLGFLINEFFWGKQLSYPWQSLADYFNKADFNNFFAIKSEAFSIHELLFFIIGIIGLIFIYKKLKIFYFVFSLIALLIPLFSGSLSSFPRFLLVVFPVYIMFARLRDKPQLIVLIAISIFLFVYYFIRFINNQWVS